MARTMHAHPTGTDPPRPDLAVRAITVAAGAAAFVGMRVWVREVDLVSGWIWQFLLSCVAFAVVSTAVRLLLSGLQARRRSARGDAGVRSDSLQETDTYRTEVDDQPT